MFLFCEWPFYVLGLTGTKHTPNIINCFSFSVLACISKGQGGIIGGLIPGLSIFTILPLN